MRPPCLVRLRRTTGPKEKIVRSRSEAYLELSSIMPIPLSGHSLKFLKFWFPVILYSAIIFYISSWENLGTPIPGLYIDKVFHLLEYIPFGFLLTRALTGTKEGRVSVFFILVVLLTFGYGLSDEFHQSFVPGRESTLGDALADTIGGTLGCWFYFLKA